MHGVLAHSILERRQQLRAGHLGGGGDWGQWVHQEGLRDQQNALLLRLLLPPLLRLSGLQESRSISMSGRQAWGQTRACKDGHTAEVVARQSIT